MNLNKPQILLSNDDGIQSPGLWAAAEALSTLGFVHVTAPRQQYSGAGRSLPSNSDGRIEPRIVAVDGKEWTVYAVGGSPAQAVLHGVLEIVPKRPDLVVSGINFGENVGTGVTISGTVGAALEAAAQGIPALAISLETDPTLHHSVATETEVDFSTAAYFTQYFGKLLLEKAMPFDVDVLKVDIPADATPQTPWKVTFLSRSQYYEPYAPTRNHWEDTAKVPYRRLPDPNDRPGSDTYTIHAERIISVTPLSLNLTSRVDLTEFENLLREED